MWLPNLKLFFSGKYCRCKSRKLVSRDKFDLVSAKPPPGSLYVCSVQNFAKVGLLVPVKCLLATVM